MIMKLGMEHRGVNVYKGCVNDDTRLTLINLTAM